MNDYLPTGSGRMIDDQNRLISMPLPTFPSAFILSYRILHTIYAYGAHISIESNVRSSVALTHRMCANIFRANGVQSPNVC